MGLEGGLDWRRRNDNANFGLIKINAAAGAFDMHRIVQFATRRWLNLEWEFEQWQQQYTKILDVHFLIEDSLDWTLCQKSSPHVAAMEITKSVKSSVGKTFATVHFRAAWSAKRRGQYNKAKLWHDRVTKQD